jgi:oligopeptide/dipeptide ABC transporter ATP-binding protein
MQPLLQVRELAVHYRADGSSPVVALNDVSFDIEAGEAVGIFGESGCGKTTLGLSLLGLLPAGGRVARGSIRFQGTNLLTVGERELEKIRGARISMVYQEPGSALNPVIRVGDQIADVVRAHGPLSVVPSRQEAKALLTQVGLAADEEIDRAYPHQLSGGQKQRVVIAQAIACRPALIIADEPTTSLDAVTQHEILTLLKMLQAKLHIALLLISHDPGELEQSVDRVLVMYAGRLVEEGPRRAVIEKPLHPYSQGLMRSRVSHVKRENHKQCLPVIPGEPPDLATLPTGCVFAARCADVRPHCQTSQPENFKPEKSRRVACFNYAH